MKSPQAPMSLAPGGSPTIKHTISHCPVCWSLFARANRRTLSRIRAQKSVALTFAIEDVTCEQAGKARTNIRHTSARLVPIVIACRIRPDVGQARPV